MSIRIRNIKGKTVALCAAKTTHKEGDLYLDDSVHHALTNKFSIDWHEEGFLDYSLVDVEVAEITRQEEKVFSR